MRIEENLLILQRIMCMTKNSKAVPVPETWEDKEIAIRKESSNKQASDLYNVLTNHKIITKKQLWKIKKRIAENNPIDDNPHPNPFGLLETVIPSRHSDNRIRLSDWSYVYDVHYNFFRKEAEIFQIQAYSKRHKDACEWLDGCPIPYNKEKMT